VFSNLERSTYADIPGCSIELAEQKFDRYLTRAFQQGGTIIYEVPEK
jgi:hypothetical protein